MSPTVGHSVIEAVRDRGVDTAFGIPGTHNLELYRALDELGLRAVTTRHEQGAGYGADGWSQLSGRPGFVVTTSGPGLLNVAAAAASAYCESRPLLIMSSGAPRGTQLGTGELHEVKDPIGALGAVLAWSRRAESAAEAVALVHDAFDGFVRARPRPVHIEVPLDLLEETADRAALGRPRGEPSLGADAALDGQLAAAARILLAASRPVILAGGGSLGAAGALLALAEGLGAPVISTINGKGVIRETHPLAVGSQLRCAAARDLANAADALLIVGSKLGAAEMWDGRIDPAGQVIRIDIDPGQLRIGPRADITIVAHSTTAVAALAAAVSEAAPAACADEWPDLAGVRAAINAEVEAADPTSVAVSRAIIAALPDDAVIAGDSSQITYLGAASTLPALAPHQLLCTPTYATLGYGLPAGIGAAIAAPERVVVCLIGDGALMFAVQELATAVAERVRLIVVCVDNGGYREIKQNMLAKGIAPLGVDLPQPDWVGLGRSFGMTAAGVSLGTVADALSSAVARDGGTLLHLRV